MRAELERRDAGEESAAKRLVRVSQQLDDLKDRHEVAEMNLSTYRDQSASVGKLTRERDDLHAALQLAEEKLGEYQQQAHESENLLQVIKELTEANAKLVEENDEYQRLLADARSEVLEMRTLAEHADTSVISAADSLLPHTPLSHSVVDPRRAGATTIFGELETYVQNSLSRERSRVHSRQDSPTMGRGGGSTLRTEVIAGSFDAPQGTPLVLSLQDQSTPAVVDRVEPGEEAYETPTKPPAKSRASLDLTAAATQLANETKPLPERPTMNSIGEDDDVERALNPPQPSSGQHQLVTGLDNNIQLWFQLCRNYAQRLAHTNTMTLNRKLRRAFDMQELTHLSNAIIDNILHDIECMHKRFPSAQQDSAVGPHMAQLVRVAVDLLTENAQQRKTMNELGLAFVSKLEVQGQQEVHKQSLVAEQQRLRAELLKSSTKRLPGGSRSAASLPSPSAVVGHLLGRSRRPKTSTSSNNNSSLPSSGYASPSYYSRPQSAASASSSMPHRQPVKPTVVSSPTSATRERGDTFSALDIPASQGGSARDSKDSVTQQRPQSAASSSSRQRDIPGRATASSTPAATTTAEAVITGSYAGKSGVTRSRGLASAMGLDSPTLVSPRRGDRPPASSADTSCRIS